MKNYTDVLIFHTRICAENVTNIFYPTRKIAFADFSCGSSNVNVLGIEDYNEWNEEEKRNFLVLIFL